MQPAGQEERVRMGCCAVRMLRKGSAVSRLMGEATRQLSSRFFSIHCRAARPESTVARAASSRGAGMTLMREGKA